MVTERRAGLSALRKKLWRDMRASGMQFAAIVLLCALGVWVYSGLDATWRMLDASVETYYAQTDLADFWLQASSLTRQNLLTLRHLDGVRLVQARTTAELDVQGLGDGVSLEIHAVDGDPALCVPLIREGVGLRYTDKRGCLLEEQFARAHGLAVGDTLTLMVAGRERHFVVRALVLSSEHLLTAKEVTPDPAHYGFVYLSSAAVPELPLNEALVALADGANAEEVERAMERALPGALVLTQKTQGSTQGARNHVTMFRNLTYVFPVMAFAVAALIVMTTLERMIGNQRVQMGTLKALGYSDRQIRRHYLAYALWPSLAGALLGLLVGRYTLPYILWDMVNANYVFPRRLEPPISLSAWLMSFLAVALSLLICLRAYNKAAKESTASLLRPKPPRAGSRILLERLPALWRRFSFNAKMIVRNLMRNKGRTFVSLVGMLCCNMLIICTLGLQDSISYFVGSYYFGTLRYDLRADLTSDAGTLESYQARLEADRVEGVMEQAVSLRGGNGVRATVLTVMKEDQTLIRLGDKGTLMELPANGLTVSRKLADVMGLHPGDTTELWLPGDDTPIRLTVTAFADTNIGQGVFMASDQWASLRKGAFRPTALLLKNPTPLCRARLEQMDEVSEIKDPDSQYAQSMRIMDSTATAFSIMSGAALGLAFVICYNMGLMNFTERTRDYATLKVLGYHQQEIRGLMLRENNLTAVLGVALGVWPGVTLTQVVLKSCESDAMVFASYVKPASILLASVITYVFTFLIEWLLTRKVRTIDMVTALKSVE